MTNDEFRKECFLRGQELDELEIPWSIQNTISCAADCRNNGFIYYRTVLANCGIEVVEDSMSAEELQKAKEVVSHCKEVKSVTVDDEIGSIHVRYDYGGKFFKSFLAVRLAFKKYQPEALETVA